MINIVRSTRHALMAVAIAAMPVLGGCDSFDQASTGCQIGLMQAFGDVVMSAAALASKSSSMPASTADYHACDDG